MILCLVIYKIYQIEIRYETRRIVVSELVVFSMKEIIINLAFNVWLMLNNLNCAQK